MASKAALGLLATGAEYIINRSMEANESGPLRAAERRAKVKHNFHSDEMNSLKRQVKIRNFFNNRARKLEIKDRVKALAMQDIAITSEIYNDILFKSLDKYSKVSNNSIEAAQLQRKQIQQTAAIAKDEREFNRVNFAARATGRMIDLGFETAGDWLHERYNKKISLKSVKPTSKFRIKT